MKAQFVILLFAVLLLTGNLGAKAIPTQPVKKDVKEKVRLEIAKSITCPDFIEENDVINQVKAIVEVDDNGRVKVLEINSANSQLKDYVSSRLENLAVKNPGQSQKFILLIRFVVPE